MEAPRLEACYFGSRQTQWPRLASVLSHTAARHCPDWTRRVRLIQKPIARQHKSGEDALLENTHKLEEWTAIIEQAPVGSRILLIDVDTFIVRPLDDIWTRSFDIAYTGKRGARWPLNGGVIFLRVSEGTQAWMRAWRTENRAMFFSEERHKPYRRKFGGMNQASLGCLLDQPISKALDILEVPCHEWNCEDASWLSFDPAVTRVVHVKSALRKAVFNLAGAPPALRPLMTLWRQLEREAASVHA